MSASARRIRQLLSWLGDRDRQLQLALDAAELGTWNWDPSTNELAWSDRCRTLIGVSADEPPSVETFLKLVHQDDRPAVEHAIESALRNGDSYSIEYRIVMPGGEVRWLHSLGRVHQTGVQSRSFGMSGIVRDVTLAHRAAESAQRQEQYLEQLRRQDAQQRIDQRYRLLVESLPLGIMLADVDGRITYLNVSMPETPMLAQPRILHALYGVAQEAIGNISRHAAATRVHVRLVVEPGNARLQVRDNGVGMREDAWHRPHCHGLHAAKARLAEFGGSLQAAGTPGQGTLLEAVVPLPQI